MGRNGLGAERFEQRGQPVFPLAHQAGKARIAGDALFHLGALGGIEHTEHVFTGQDIGTRRFGVIGQIMEIADVHRSRHTRSWPSPRRIQLFTDPSGAPMRRASSS
ncbi:hypothetical protein D9M73_281830 [compost metagenome]